jgi:hypothetical protein
LRSRFFTGKVTRVGFFSMKKLFLVNLLNCTDKPRHAGFSARACCA